MPTEINRSTIDDAVERLRARYDDPPVERDPVTLPAEEFDDHVTHARQGYDGGGYAWVVRDPADAPALSPTTTADPDDRRRVLLLYPRGSDEWGLPGGGREGEESFADAAAREVREETGIACEVTGVWLLRRHVWTSEDPGDDRRTHSLHVFFDARYAGGHVSIQPGEANGAAWFADLPDRMLPANERRAATWDPDPDSGG